ncbi:MAG: amidohydrolase family protein [Methanobrevibacter sp.]|jgi:5-methylthioadenosine/S-adenosylhomocysteine deaminase|nr:amidohydrolase family protein [Candidatus Methanoflexus mossambicus]
MESNAILIKNANLITPICANNGYWNDEIINRKNVSVLIEDDKISEIDSKISENSVDKIINAEGKILMPSLINTHTHSSMNLLRGVADDLELDSWLNDHIWPMEAGLNGDLCYLGTQLAIIEMIKTGTTCFSDMYFYMDSVAKAVDESGIRAVLSNGMIDFGDANKRESEFKDSIQLIKNLNNSANGRIKVYFGPHSPITASKELLLGVREYAEKYNTGIHIHMNETQKEIEDIQNQYNMRPFEYLNDIGFLDGIRNDDNGNDNGNNNENINVLAAHCVWLSDREIAILKENNVKVSHNPCSNMKLASGIAPVNKLIDNNVCVSLGTDGVASNNNLDLFEEMKFASLLSKVNTLNPKVLPANDLIKMTTLNAARALALDKEIGSIEIGKKADMILMDTNNISFTPTANSLISHIVYSANGYSVDTTICDGNVLMENKQLKVFNEEEILNNANKATLKLKNAIENKD